VSEEVLGMESGHNDFLANRPNKHIITATLQTKHESHFFCVDQATEQLISTASSTIVCHLSSVIDSSLYSPSS